MPSSRYLPNPGIESRFPTLQVDSLLTEPPRKPKNTGVSSLSLPQKIFPTQESNQGLLHCRQILHQLSYQWSSYAEYIIQNAGLDESQAGIKIARINFNNLRYADNTTLMEESEENTKQHHDNSERGEWKSWFKTQHSKNYDQCIPDPSLNGK